jgi:hypothetical protein
LLFFLFEQPFLSTSKIFSDYHDVLGDGADYTVSEKENKTGGTFRGVDCAAIDADLHIDGVTEEFKSIILRVQLSFILKEPMEDITGGAAESLLDPGYPSFMPRSEVITMSKVGLIGEISEGH